jgi:hypothetical protein
VATTRQYWSTLRTWQQNIAQKFGVNIQYGSMEGRAVAATDAAMVAILVKALTDKGVLTDADILAAWQDARDDAGWVQESADPPARRDP